ncbi:hypothetical protein PUN28_019021 [Cardiocondyla obscurior]|uniref:Uncharacterized protein n=1 Tax=Cardiocondyla obscurior TaxID=286306 RepID=A0AAW2EGT6_9HYME
MQNAINILQHENLTPRCIYICINIYIYIYIVYIFIYLDFHDWNMVFFPNSLFFKGTFEARCIFGITTVGPHSLVNIYSYRPTHESLTDSIIFKCNYNHTIHRSRSSAHYNKIYGKRRTEQLNSHK